MLVFEKLGQVLRDWAASTSLLGRRRAALQAQLFLDPIPSLRFIMLWTNRSKSPRFSVAMYK
jgi:hypothetical protein